MELRARVGKIKTVLGAAGCSADSPELVVFRGSSPALLYARLTVCPTTSEPVCVTVA